MSEPFKHKKYLLEALEQAKKNEGFCAPNPSVGAVIVDENDKIISSGYHLGCNPHAEIEALKKASSINLDAARMYITLEPCCHTGRTPPCTEAIIRSGIKKFFFAFQDPNPIVSGKSAAILQSANITCEAIPLPEIDLFYKGYQYWHKTKLPYITAKIAMTLNGKIAGADSKPLPITAEPINQLTHRYRKNHDAILTTSKTIKMDNPQLNVRQEQQIIAKPIYIIDRTLSLTLNEKIFSTAKSVTLFYGNKIEKHKLQILKNANIRHVEIEETENLLNMQKIIELIGKDGIHHLWIEAGAKCFTHLVNNNLLQRSLIYILLRQL